MTTKKEEKNLGIFTDNVSGKKFIKVVPEIRQKMFKFENTGDCLQGVFIDFCKENNFSFYKFEVESEIIKVPKYKELFELITPKLRNKNLKIILELFTPDKKIFSVFEEYIEE